MAFGEATGLQMRSVRVLTVVLALGSASSTSFAFEEAKGSSPPEAAQQSAPQRPVQKPMLNLNGTGTSIDPAPRASGGQEVRIPGLGKLGVFPKLDFGLELLYGGRDEKVGDADRIRPEGDEMQIRGSIKHRF